MIEEDAVPYLIRAGLLSNRHVVRGEISVEDNSRRNSNVRVLSSIGPDLFVKQADPSDRSTLEGIRREAECYQYFQGAGAHPVGRVAPRFYLFDSSKHVLVIEYLRSAATLRQFLDRRPLGPWHATAGALARAMSVYLSKRYPHPSLERLAGSRVPWALRLAFPGPELLRLSSAGQLELIRVVQRDNDMLSVLDSLRQQYGGTHLIHGDLRWDNILVHGDKRRQTKRIRFIDWELAGIGDPAWDVGSVLASFWAHCLQFLDPPGEVSPRSLRAALVSRLPRYQSECRVFWRALVRTLHLNRDTAGALRSRAIQYCGARLLQSAFEWSPGETLSPLAATFVQLGLNLLRRPGAAPRFLFGITAREN